MKWSTFGLQAQRLAELLSVAAEPAGLGGQPSEAPTTGQLLDNRLSAPLALEPDGVDSIPAVLNRPCSELLPLVGRSFGSVLTDATTDVAALQTLRDYGKELARRWEDGPEHEVAVTIHYAAIAAALCHHGTRLVSRPFPDLARSLELLVNTPWMPAPMVKLLSDARQLCREP